MINIRYVIRMNSIRKVITCSNLSTKNNLPYYVPRNQASSDESHKRKLQTVTLAPEYFLTTFLNSEFYDLYYIFALNKVILLHCNLYGLLF